MNPLNLSANPTFLQFMGGVEKYALRVREMWPSFWLKAAAVHDGTEWHLCSFILVGRWSDVTGAESVWEPGDALVAVSKPLDATEAWALLERLGTDGMVELAPSVIARAPDVYVLPPDEWQVRTPPSTSKTIADVIDEAEWCWLHYFGWNQWISDWQAKEALRKRIVADLERVGLRNYQSFISAYFGSGEQRPNDSDFDTFQCQLDLPLALRVSPGIADPSLHTRPVTIALRAPLTMGELVVTSGHRPSSTHAQVPVTDMWTTQDGWSCGIATIPAGNDKMWLTQPLLDRRLLYEIALPTPAARVAETLAYIYAPRTFAKAPKKGAKKWESDLLDGQSHQFEVALLNALARFGIPALFSGQFQEQGLPSGGQGAKTSPSPAAPKAGQPKANGPATPGFDLIALDHAKQRAVLISAKGTPHSPGDNEIDNLVNGVDMVSRMLEGWHVTGLIACHASATVLVRVRQRDDIVVWGQDELKALLYADTPDPVKRMLWTPPGWQQFNIFRGYIM